MISGSGGRLGIVRLRGGNSGRGGMVGKVILGSVHDDIGGNVKLGGVN